MPTFMELMELVANQGADVHALRQGFIEQLHRKNGRALILYAANPRPTRTGVTRAGRWRGSGLSRRRRP